MRTNSGKNFETVQVDPVSNNYYVIIPEWVANELSWYEDTKLEYCVEGGELIFSEAED
jgi:hypothetical protein